MRLKQLLAYDEIVIQCHDNPDADSLVCGYALYRYLQGKGKQPRLIYGGSEIIRKSNLQLLVRDMEIPIEHVFYLKKPELLVMVDCQYEGGNTTVFEAKQVAVIDHHRVCTKLPELSVVNSQLGACATLMWSLLKQENYDFQKDRKLLTALYYGLYTDTIFFAEILHPMDMDLRDENGIDKTLLTKYRNANLSLEELEVAGAALLHSDYMDEYRAAIVKSGPCDANILGVISDLVLEVDAVDICVVFNIMPDCVKLSVRSCIKEVKANELAKELCEGIGSGGGHYVKAGGTIPLPLMAKAYLDLCEKRGYQPQMEMNASGKTEKPTASGVKAVLEQRLKDYLDDTKIVYAKDCLQMEEQMVACHKKPIPWSYVRGTDLFEAGTDITVRTMDGDAEIAVSEDLFFIFEPKGGVHWCSKSEFFERYRAYDDRNDLGQDAEYIPRMKNNQTGQFISPEKYARICVPKEEDVFYARRLEQKVKLFTNEDSPTYCLGRKGDYLVRFSERLEDIVIMEKMVFESICEPVAKKNERKKAVIFDLDGTLLDTLEDLKEAVNAALSAYHCPVCTLEQVRSYVGNGVKKLMERAVPHGEQNPDFTEIFESFKEYYSAHCLDATKPYEQIQFLLEELSKRGIAMAIVSNKMDSAVKELNERFFGKYIFTAIGEREGVQKKPAKDMVVKALEELGVDASDALFVGDSEVDIRTAGNAGLPCISVTWGFKDEEFLREQGAETLIHRPSELLYHLQ